MTRSRCSPRCASSARCTRSRSPTATTPGWWSATTRRGRRSNDPRLSKDMQAALASGGGVVAEGLPGPAFARHMLVVDPPDHTRLRRLVVGGVLRAPDRGTAADASQTIVDDLLDAIAAHGPDSRGRPRRGVRVPAAVHGDLRAARRSRAGRERRSARALAGRCSRRPRRPRSTRGRRQASDAVVAMLDARSSRPSDATPGDDLVSALIDARDGDERLDQQELLSTIFQLIVAGHDTTASLIGNSVVALLRHPDQLAALRARTRTGSSAAVEEFLRYDAPVPHSTFRYARRAGRARRRDDPGRRAGHHQLGVGQPGRRLRYADPETLDIDRDRRPPPRVRPRHPLLPRRAAGAHGRAARARSLLRRFPQLRLAVPTTTCTGVTATASSCAASPNCPSSRARPSSPRLSPRIWRDCHTWSRELRAPSREDRRARTSDSSDRG